MYITNIKQNIQICVYTYIYIYICIYVGGGDSPLGSRLGSCPACVRLCARFGSQVIAPVAVPFSLFVTFPFPFWPSTLFLFSFEIMGSFSLGIGEIK